MISKRKAVLFIILIAVIVIASVILYFTSGRDLLYLEIALMIVGVLNVISGILNIKAQNKGLGVLLLCSGAVIIVIMVVAVLI